MKRLAPWMICPDCNGDGHHAKALGEINVDEWEDDELEHYFAGGYDNVCGTCRGAGKVREDYDPDAGKPWWANDPEALAERRMGA